MTPEEGRGAGLRMRSMEQMVRPLDAGRRRPDRDRARKRWGHAGLLVEGRRGQGDWEEIGILGRRALRDTRPLAVRGQPEVREYRARFFDGSDHLSGDWSPVETVTVSP
jgi:hypothetical protein